MAETGFWCLTTTLLVGGLTLGTAAAEPALSSGTDIRALRGKIVREDAFFIYLERRDGVWQIGKASVIKIHRRPVRQGAGT